MKIQVTGIGAVEHGIGEDANHVPQLIRIPPGVHVTSDEDPDSYITPELAKFLINTTNGHVIEYHEPDPETTRVVQVSATVSRPHNEPEGLKEAQDAQIKRLAKVADDRAAEKAVQVPPKSAPTPPVEVVSQLPVTKKTAAKS